MAMHSLDITLMIIRLDIIHCTTYLMYSWRKSECHRYRCKCREYQETNQQTVTFSVYDINNAIDRCFNAFSNYDSVEYEIDPNEFTLNVAYLPFQETDILRILIVPRCCSPRT